jgi:signal transduction histidine kinase
MSDDMGEGDPPPDGKGILHPEGMQAVRDLAAGIAHEVNNILGVIIGNAHLAKKSAQDPTSVEKYLGEVRGAAEEGRELMRNLALIAGADPARPRTLSLNDLVVNALDGLDKPVETDLSGEDPSVEVDLWLAQDALASTARFMAATSSVGFIRVATRVVGSAVALTIEDDGGSLDEKDLARVFTPFFKAERRPNAGVGMTKLADFAARSGGHVSAGVREPNGLRIVLTLPVAATG